MLQIQEKEHCTYKYLEALSFLEIVWHGYVSTTELQKTMQEIAYFLKENQISYLLVDARLLNAAKTTDENWIRTYCIPLLAGTSIRRFARVAYPTAIQQNIESAILNAIDQEHLYSFGMRTFERREVALEWLFILEALREQMPYRGDYRASNLI